MHVYFVLYLATCCDTTTVKRIKKKVIKKTFSCFAPCLHSCTSYWHFVLLIKKKITTHSTLRHNETEYFLLFFPSGQVKGGMCSCAASDALTLLLTLGKRLSVNQIRAASQTSPRVRCYRASPTMLHCSLHTAYPPQRSGGFQWGNHEVRRSPFVENNAEEFFSSCGWGELFVRFRAAVMTRWEVSDNCILPSARIKPQPCLGAKISDYKSGFCQRGGFTHLCPSRLIPNI